MMFNKSHVCVAVVSLLGGELAFGQAATPPATAASGAASSLEAVIITGQKVVRDLQKSAIAVTAISGAALDQAAIASVKDLGALAPGLVVSSTPSNPLSLTIRGVGYEGLQNNSAQPGVSYNLNGVYISNPNNLNSNFLDVDQLEVLRGPQGTVLGQNSDGGAINVTTVLPTMDRFKGYGDVSYGRFNYERARTAVNVPVGEDLAIRAAFQQQHYDGSTKTFGIYGHPEGYKLGGENSVNGRISLRWFPTDKLTIDVWTEFYKNHAHGDAFKNIYDPSPDPYTTSANYPSTLKSSSSVQAAKASYDFSFGTGNVILSYQDGKISVPTDLDKVDFNTSKRLYGADDIASNNARLGHSLTQEIDLISKPGGRLDWIIGLFSVQDVKHTSFLEYHPAMEVPDPGSYYPTSIADPAAAFAPGTLAFETYATDKLTSSSIYGQGTYRLTNALRVTGGARYTDDRQHSEVSVYFNPNVYNSTGYKAATGKAEVEYDLLPQNTVYAMWSSGIKPGGTNLNPGATVIPAVFDREKNNAVEVGSKNQFMEKTLRLNIAAYYNFYRGLQVDSEDPIPFLGGLTNIQKVNTYGLEVEGTALLPYNLRLDGNFATMGGKVKSHQQFFDPGIASMIDRDNGGPFTPGDLAGRHSAFFAPSSDIYGRRPPKIPSFSANLGLGHLLRMGDGSSVSTHIDYTYRKAYYFRVYNSATDLVPTLQQWDLAFSYKAPSQKWHVDLLIKNLLDRASVTSRYTDNFGVGAVSNYYVPPRSYIARLGYEF